MRGPRLIAALNEPTTQAGFAALVGVTERAIRQHLEAGHLKDGETAHQWLLAYCARLRAVAGGQNPDADTDAPNGLNLTQERAALARAQRLATEIKTAVARGEYAPVGALEDVLAAASAAVADRLEALEGLLRKVAPDLPDNARDAVLAAVASARNEWGRSTETLVLARLEEGDDE